MHRVEAVSGGRKGILLLWTTNCIVSRLKALVASLLYTTASKSLHPYSLRLDVQGGCHCCSILIAHLRQTCVDISYCHWHLAAKVSGACCCCSATVGTFYRLSCTVYRQERHARVQPESPGWLHAAQKCRVVRVRLTPARSTPCYRNTLTSGAKRCMAMESTLHWVVRVLAC